MDIAIYTLGWGCANCERARQYKQVMLNWVVAATTIMMCSLLARFTDLTAGVNFNKKYLEEIGWQHRQRQKIVVAMDETADFKAELGNMFREDIRKIRREKDESRQDMFAVTCRATWRRWFVVLMKSASFPEAMGILVVAE